MTMDRQKTKEEVIDALHGVASEMHDKMLKGVIFYAPISMLKFCLLGIAYLMTDFFLALE